MVGMSGARTARSREGRPHGVGVRALCMALIAAIMVSGCVTVKNADGSPEELRQAIRTGELVEPGERVTLVTPSMGERTFTVAEIDDDFIRGENTQVPIDEIVSLEKSRIDPVKTFGAIAGGYLLMSLVAAVALVVGLGDVL